LYSHHIGNESWVWYREDALPDAAIEMLVIDGPPTTVGKLARYPAGPILFPRLSGNAAVFLDDAARKQEKAVLMRWCMEFPEFAPKGMDCEKGCAVLRKSSYTDR